MRVWCVRMMGMVRMVVVPVEGGVPKPSLPTHVDAVLEVAAVVEGEVRLHCTDDRRGRGDSAGEQQS
jgi:hypothetical protein